MRESKVEKSCKSWAKSEGWLSYKWVSPGNVGVPDQIFLKAGRIVFVEFKAPGKPLSVMQAKKAKDIIGCGFEVYKIDNIDDFKIILENKS